MIILLNPKCWRHYWTYYRHRVTFVDFIGGLFLKPKKRTIHEVEVRNQDTQSDNLAETSVIDANKKITLLLKPTDSLNVESFINALYDWDFIIEDIFDVKPFYKLLKALYKNHGIGAIYVSELYRIDPELNTRSGIVLQIKRGEPTDLLDLKGCLRRLSGFDYYLISYKSNTRFIGLNTVHIPDKDSMEEETDLIRRYRIV